MATGLLGGTMVFLVSLFVLGIRVNAAAKDDTVSATYVQDRLEDLKKQELLTADTGVLKKDYFVRTLATGVESWVTTVGSGQLTLYEREWKLENIDLGVGTGADKYTNPLKLITISVRPTTSKLGKGSERYTQRTVTVQTYSRYDYLDPPANTKYKLF
jgi:hypothetical protein